jgi:2-polyprenyl-3-methyl-5-hydroxy-6-metoxy-1,4-benzoquinol methylase
MMKISGGLKDDGIVVGNLTDKYGSKNIFFKYIMGGFRNSLAGLLNKASSKTIYEAGCGEGYWVIKWHLEGIHVRGSDFSSQIIELARANAIDKGISPDLFSVKNIYDLEPEMVNADLIVCTEVLEHLEQPEKALRVLSKVAKKYVILSVPREPLWRFLNMLRLKYLRDFGNTPGHIQHWSLKKFVLFVEQYFEIVEIQTPIPWIMLLCRVRR